MLLVTPTPLEEALRLLREKRLVPTALSSSDLRDLAAEVKRAALFSARMTQMRPLQALAEGLTAMLEGTGNLADAKLLLSEVYTALGYNAEAGGFPQDAPDTVPPAMRGTLRDLSSQRRMELSITTNYRMVANEAFVKRTTEDEQRLYQFPCYELIRIAPRITPRGFKRGKDGALDLAPGEDWETRFVAAGGELYEKGTRMIAPKGSDVWIKLGEGAGGYKDTLGNPFAPFAFGSGKGLRELPRGECLLIGVITEEDVIAKMPVSLQGALKAQAKQVDPKILAAFDDLEDDGEWLRLAKAKQDKVEAARKLRNRVETVAMLMNGGTSAGALLGWITRRLKLPPKMMSVAQADSLLDVGVAVKSKHGDSIRFGQALKSKLGKMGAEGERRKTHLAWGLHTVMSGAESGRLEKGEWRRNYARIYKTHGKKEKAMLVVARVKDGEVFDIMRKDVPWVKSRGMENRSASGQSLTPTLLPYATARKQEGAPNSATLRARCKLLASALSNSSSFIPHPSSLP